MSEVLAPLELTPKERELLGIIQDPARFCENFATKLNRPISFSTIASV